MEFSRSNIDCVLFDLGGTLTYIDGGQALHSRAIYDQLNLLIAPLPPVMSFEDHTYFLVNKYFDLRSEYFKISSDFYLHEFMPDALIEYGIPESTAREISPRMCDAFFEYECEHVRLFSGAIGLLAMLEYYYYKLGLISNTCYTSKQLIKFLSCVSIDKFFKIVLTSCEERCPKPNAAIFQKALNFFGCAPERALYIGDNPVFDAKGAENAGMKSLTVTSDFTLEKMIRMFQ